jgi:7-keto-8-aminopelargonate synthetase-like enzyme
VVGENGRGAAEYHDVESVSVRAATLSKAYCASGALFACSPAEAARLRWLPPIAAASAGSPLLAAASAASLRYVREQPQVRAELRQAAQNLRARLRDIGVETADTPAPIVSFALGGREDMLALRARAFDAGLYLHYCTYVGAPREGLIRCAVFHDHSAADFDTLIDLIQTL